jgi:hypothetical protein
MWLETSKGGLANVHGQKMGMSMDNKWIGRILPEFGRTLIRARARFCVIRHITSRPCYGRRIRELRPMQDDRNIQE